jgi:hypothetical protein
MNRLVLLTGLLFLNTLSQADSISLNNGANVQVGQLDLSYTSPTTPYYSIQITDPNFTAVGGFFAYKTPFVPSGGFPVGNVTSASPLTSNDPPHFIFDDGLPYAAAFSSVTTIPGSFYGFPSQSPIDASPWTITYSGAGSFHGKPGTSVDITDAFSYSGPGDSWVGWMNPIIDGAKVANPGEILLFNPITLGTCDVPTNAGDHELVCSGTIPFTVSNYPGGLSGRFEYQVYATPEPSSVVLTLTGVSLFFLLGFRHPLKIQRQIHSCSV